MLFTFLRIRQQYKDTKDAVNDPSSFAADTATGVVMGYITSFIIGTLLILGSLGVLGYASVLGGPYGFARVIFWILLIITIISGSMMITIIRFMRKGIKKGVSQMKEDVIDVKAE